MIRPNDIRRIIQHPVSLAVNKSHNTRERGEVRDRQRDLPLRSRASIAAAYCDDDWLGAPSLYFAYFGPPSAHKSRLVDQSLPQKRVVELQLEINWKRWLQPRFIWYSIIFLYCFTLSSRGVGQFGGERDVLSDIDLIESVFACLPWPRHRGSVFNLFFFFFFRRWNVKPIILSPISV